MVAASAIEAVQKVLSQEHIHMRDSSAVSAKLQKMVAGGADTFLVISDFDHTLSRAYNEAGIECWSTYAIFENYPEITGQKFIDDVNETCKKYIPIEFCDKLTIAEKIPHMVEWWKSSHELVMALGLTKDDLVRMVKEGQIRLRDGADSLMKSLAAASVPLIIFSAGIGNVITQFLEQALGGALPANIHVVSNMLNFDQKGVLSSFSHPLIHTFNKNSSVIPHDAPFYKEMDSRRFVLLLGDSMGDQHMDVGVEHHSEADSLKIGFLNRRSHLLPKYMDIYDIVIVDDQTMQVPNAIFQAVSGNLKGA